MKYRTLWPCWVFFLGVVSGINQQSGRKTVYVIAFMKEGPLCYILDHQNPCN